MRSECIQVGDYLLASFLELDKLPGERCVINTINAYSWVVANSNEEFKNALRMSDVLLPDGVGAVIAARLLARKKIRKIAGADLHRMLLGLLEKEGGRCFYLGASTEALDKIAVRVASEYPSVKVASYSPPYKADFSDEDNARMHEAIRAFGPDVVFVGMTAPKQEIWISRNLRYMDASVVCGIGAVFDFYSRLKNRPPRWMISLNLEWFGRLISDPGRLWKRYLVYNAVFLCQVMRQAISFSARRKGCP